jgi:hypothetical protein
LHLQAVRVSQFGIGSLGWSSTYENSSKICSFTLPFVAGTSKEIQLHWLIALNISLQANDGLNDVKFNHGRKSVSEKEHCSKTGWRSFLSECFHCTRVKAISCTPVKTVLSPLCRFSQNSEMLNTVVCRLFVPNRTQMRQ